MNVLYFCSFSDSTYFSKQIIAPLFLLVYSLVINQTKITMSNNELFNYSIVYLLTCRPPFLSSSKTSRKETTILRRPLSFLTERQIWISTTQPFLKQPLINNTIELSIKRYLHSISMHASSSIVSRIASAFGKQEKD